jgi:hypothetical protein
MTQTRPWRRIIRHFSHIFLVEGLTFISNLQSWAMTSGVVEKHGCRVVAGV